MNKPILSRMKMVVKYSTSGLLLVSFCLFLMALIPPVSGSWSKVLGVSVESQVTWEPTAEADKFMAPPVLPSPTETPTATSTIPEEALTATPEETSQPTSTQESDGEQVTEPTVEQNLPTDTQVPTIEPVVPTEVPPTEIPPTEILPTEVPPTEIPPTSEPPAEVAPTEVPAGS